MTTTLLWFRRDLRLRDNPALAHCLAKNHKIITVFINAIDREDQWPAGSASRWYLHQSLKKLETDLARIGLPLHVMKGNPLRCLTAQARQHDATEIVWNSIPEPRHIQQDRSLENQLQKQGISVRSFQDHSLFSMGSVLKADGTPYKVFTPFWRQLSNKLTDADCTSRLHTLRVSKTSASIPQSAIEKLDLLDEPPWHNKLEKHWDAGEQAALETLDAFAEESLESYATKRDFPASRHTSRLSAALHFGELSPWRIVDTLRPAFSGEWGNPAAIGAEAFLRQIGWREFAINLLNDHPRSPTASIDPRFDDDQLWLGNAEYLEAWQKGETGYPLIDAAMNELWETGYMHNRMRMLTASFLVKNLGQHWLHGARWFWDTLVDADLANNTMGWQWVAGCGCDAAPYYRIFNPDLQAKKFDAQGTYLNRWGKPALTTPIVNLKISRDQALERYKNRPAIK